LRGGRGEGLMRQPDIATRLHHVQQRITEAEHRFGRPPHSVKLLAVSKTRRADELRGAIKAGQNCFGENYAQEALEKMRLLASELLEWHFIGDIQANKAKAIAQNFAWVHSVWRWKIAQRLNEHRPLHLPPLNICLQVNVSQEMSKGGVTLAELSALAFAINELPRLKLRGLMTIPAPCADFAQQRLPYRQLHEALLELQAKGLTLDTLSMGMTHDLEAAISEGSTLVRIGTAIFGERGFKHA
jgi:pyridoxal phosphate enzyme (YggS family)